MRTRVYRVSAVYLLISVLAACGGGGGSSPPPDPYAGVPNSLRPLMGKMTLNYKFSGTSTVFTSTATFNAASLTSDKAGLTAAASPYGGMACQVAPASSGYQYFCLILNPSTSMDTFLMNLSGSSLSGVYTYCTAGTTSSDCAAKIVLTPSGTVTGTMTAASASMAEAAPQTPPLGSDDAAQAKSLHASETPMPVPTAEQQAQIQALAASLAAAQNSAP